MAAEIEINGSFLSQTPFSLDAKRLFAGERVYASVLEVNETILSDYRHKSLEVIIKIGTGYPRTWWYRDGILDTDLVPKNDGDVVILNDVNGVYKIEAGRMLTHFAVKPTIQGLAAFFIGTTDGGKEIMEDIELPVAKTTPFVVAVFADTDQNIYIKGIQGTGSIVTLTFYTK